MRSATPLRTERVRLIAQSSSEGHRSARCQVRCHLHEPLHVAYRVRAASMVPIGVAIHVGNVVIEQETGEAICLAGA